MRDRGQKRWVVLSHMFPAELKPAFGRFVEDQVLGLYSAGESVVAVTCEFTSAPFFRPLRMLKALVRWFLKPKVEFRVTASGTPYVVFFCPALRLGAGVQAILYSIAFLRVATQVKAIIGEVDVIHAHTSLFDANAARLVAARWNCPYIVTEHTGPFSLLTNSPLKKYLTGRGIAGAERVVAVSNFLKSKIVAAYPNAAPNIEVIPNAIAVELFKSNESQQLERSPVIGWLGHFDPVKRVDRLIEAFLLLKSENSTAKLKLIGAGDLREKFAYEIWHRRLGDSIEIVRASSREEVAKALKSIDMLVVSSDVETFSVATVEALACGIPVVATDCGGPADILVDESLGLIVDMSPQGIFAGIKKISTGDVGSRKKRSEYAASKYSRHIIAQQYVRLADRFVENSSAPQAR